MSESIVFRGTHVRHFDGRQEEGGAFVRVHLTSEFSSNVMEEMGWQDPGPSATEAKLGGELLGTHLILTPGDTKIGHHEIQFDIASVDDFKVVTVIEKESKRRELRFVARSSAAGVAALVDNYIRRVGDHQGALKVSYVKQETLDLQEKAAPKPKKESTGCKACDAGIPLKENDDAEHVDGKACKVWESKAYLPVPPMETATLTEPSLAGATTSDRKKARRAEEEKKRALKNGQGWPEPNEHGVYEASPELILEFMGKKCAAAIEYLQIGPDQWISVRSASHTDGSYSGPLKAHAIYPSKEIAIAIAAYDGTERAASATVAATSPAIKKQHQAIHDWFLEVYVKYSSQVTAEDGWMDVNYEVADPEAEDAGGVVDAEFADVDDTEEVAQ